MRILVTGATGLIGSTLVRLLLEREANVRIFRRAHSSLDLLASAAGRVEHAVGDVTDAHSVRAAMEGVTHVFHAAALVGPQHRLNALRRVNVRGTGHVVNAALDAGVRRLVHTSSIAALGRPARGGVCIDESMTWERNTDRSPYALSKHEAELEAFRGAAEGLEVVVVNPALVFGAGRPDENTGRIVERVRNGWLPAVPAGGTCVVDVRDVAAGHLQALHLGEPGERYLLGGENLSWRAILETLARAFATSVPHRTLSPRAAYVAGALAEAAGFVTSTPPLLTRALAESMSHTYRYDASKAERELGCTFRPFADTAAYLAHALRLRASRSDNA